MLSLMMKMTTSLTTRSAPCVKWNKKIMPYKKKNYLNVSGIKIPRPPQMATHIKIHCKDKKYATVAINDIDTLLGTEGKLQYQRFNMKSKKLVEEYKDKYKWDGNGVINFKFDD